MEKTGIKTVSFPSISCSDNLLISFSSSTICKIAPALSNTICPIRVGVMPCLPRIKIGTPISCSKLFSATLRDGCDTYSSLAALDIDCCRSISLI